MPVLAICAAACLGASLAGLLSCHRRRLRLTIGAPLEDDLAVLTGTADRGELGQLPGVRHGPDGRLALTSDGAASLPLHPISCWLESELGHGICLAIAILGLAGETVGGSGLAVSLLATAIAHQAIGWLWLAALKLEARQID
jgi:hypothetical protein